MPLNSLYIITGNITESTTVGSPVTGTDDSIEVTTLDAVTTDSSPVISSTKSENDRSTYTHVVTSATPTTTPTPFRLSDKDGCPPVDLVLTRNCLLLEGAYHCERDSDCRNKYVVEAEVFPCLLCCPDSCLILSGISGICKKAIKKDSTLCNTYS